jgi:hypothetical protein
LNRGAQSQVVATPRTSDRFSRVERKAEPDEVDVARVGEIAGAGVDLASLNPERSPPVWPAQILNEQLDQRPVGCPSSGIKDAPSSGKGLERQ